MPFEHVNANIVLRKLRGQCFVDVTIIIVFGIFQIISIVVIVLVFLFSIGSSHVRPEKWRTLWDPFWNKTDSAIFETST